MGLFWELAAWRYSVNRTHRHSDCSGRQAGALTPTYQTIRSSWWSNICSLRDLAPGCSTSSFQCRDAGWLGCSWWCSGACHVTRDHNTRVNQTVGSSWRHWHLATPTCRPVYTTSVQFGSYFTRVAGASKPEFHEITSVQMVLLAQVIFLSERGHPHIQAGKFTDGIWSHSVNLIRDPTRFFSFHHYTTSHAESPLSSSTTPSLFHSQLKTNLFPQVIPTIDSFSFTGTDSMDSRLLPWHPLYGSSWSGAKKMREWKIRKWKV